MTNDDIATGQTALKAYVGGVDGWEADFVSDQAYRDGAIEIIRVMDGGGTVTSCGAALYQSITKAGYGDDVTTEQCLAAATAVVAAVATARK